MIAFRIKYNIFGDQTDINFTDDFYNLDYVAKLDCLQDTIAKLTKQYNLTLSAEKKVGKIS
jgi:hypothetical protein